MASPPEEKITFPCQECGKLIVFPADSAGRVETCPECGRYVDVPDKSGVPPAEPDAVPPKDLAPVERTTLELWFEVSAVLCLAYLPALYHALGAVNSGRLVEYSPFHEALYRTILAAQIAMPLFAIIVLARDDWSLFGIVRPRWVVDPVLACVIWFCCRAFRQFAASAMPLFILRLPHPHLSGSHVVPQGVFDYSLLFVACIASGLQQELIYRGYLIPRFERLLRSTWLAVLLAALLFGTYHLYEGVAATIVITGTGIIYGIAFCLTRRLWPICVAHAMHNFLLWL